jgi:hypothetical protein
MRPPPPHLAGLTVDHPGPTPHVRRAVADGVFWCGEVIVRDLAVWYSGAEPDETGMLMPTGGPLVVELRAPDTTLVAFDERTHGYSALVEELTGVPAPTRRFGDDALFRVVCWAGYSIDWDDEKATWLAPGEDTYTTPAGRLLSWDALTREGFDAFGIFVERAGEWTELVQLELA